MIISLDSCDVKTCTLLHVCSCTAAGVMASVFTWLHKLVYIINEFLSNGDHAPQ